MILLLTITDFELSVVKKINKGHGKISFSFTILVILKIKRFAFIDKNRKSGSVLENDFWTNFPPPSYRFCT